MRRREELHGGRKGKDNLSGVFDKMAYLKKSLFSFNRTRGNKDGKVSHTTDTRMPPKQGRDSETGPPAFKLTVFDLLSLECKDCYCLHHREFKHPRTSNVLLHLSINTVLFLTCWKTWEEELFDSDSHLYIMLQDGRWLCCSWLSGLIAPFTR